MNTNEYKLNLIIKVQIEKESNTLKQYERTWLKTYMNK